MELRTILILKGSNSTLFLKEVGSVVTYYYFIFSPFPLFSFIYVNNIPGRDGQEENTHKMGKEENENFPLREIKTSLKGYFYHTLICKVI